jgi:heavy metal sensor kinase
MQAGDGRTIPSIRLRSKPLGLRIKLTLWISFTLGASLVAGFLWVHFGLRSVLEARNDASLERKATELASVVRDARSESIAALEAEIHREVEAYQDEGLVVVVRTPERSFVAPGTGKGLEVSRQLASTELTEAPKTLTLPGSPERYRVLRTRLGSPDSSLDIGLSLAETESTLAQFDRRVATGGLVFLALAVLGGLFLSRQALRPVAQSIYTAKRLDPSNLSERLPLTGAGDELDELAGTINALLDRLAAYHAQVIRLTADASHELRSPLGAMRAAIEVALSQPRDLQQYRDVLSSLGEQCERLTALVNGLLLLAQADAGELELKKAPVDLTALVGNVVEMYEPLADERDVRVTVESEPSIEVLGDSSRLLQLVTNLFDNAIKFTTSRGSVLLHVETRAGEARLTVTDSGVGIPEQHLSHIFERFYRADSARSSGGSGLGLSICKWIVEAHGGSINIQSREGVGTSVVVFLPGAASCPTEDNPPTEPDAATMSLR